MNWTWEQILALPLELKALAVAGVFFGISTVLRVVFRHYKNVSPDDPRVYRVVFSVLSRKTRSIFFIVVSLYVGIAIFFDDKKWFGSVDRVFFVVCIIQLWVWARCFVEVFFDRKTRQLSPNDISRVSSFRALSFIANMLIVIFLFLFMLDNFGVNISALVTGLGIGGIAIALAVQNILGDLLASVTIILDKPFVVGDSIAVGDFAGTIENIGVKTTRVRSLTGEQVIFSNADLLQSRIRNYKRLHERRVLLNFGITYSTELELLARLPAMIAEIVSSQPKVRLDRSHFKGFGASSLDFEVVYFVLSSEYGVYMDVQQYINLAIAQRFKELNVEFAYPTQTLYINTPLVQEASEIRKQPT